MTRPVKHHQYYQLPLDQQEEVQYLLEPVITELNLKPCIQADQSGDENKMRRPCIASYVQTIKPVLQKGPMCGIVALTMAYELLSNTHRSPIAHPECILEFAQRAGFTKQGEMFSVHYMKHIGQEHLSLKAETVPMDSLNVVSLLKLLVSPSKAVLVPYDADKNHSPCLAAGHKAHWCILVGFTLTLQITEHDSDLLPLCTPRQDHLLLKEDSTEKFLSLLSSEKRQVTGIHVFARHGKSRHMGLWDWDRLRESNGNLVEIDPQRTKPGEYVLPEPGGIRDELCSHVVILSVHDC